MNIHWLQHVPFEGLGCIESWALDKKHSLSATRLFAGDPLPCPSSFDWLIVMGGPMGAYDDDKFDWLVREKQCIERAIANGRHVLGVCLGAQLIASVLGGKVYPNRHKEIGWFPVRLTAEARGSALFGGFAETVPAFHWHGDTFDLPKGAVRMIETDVCANQAFVYDGKVVGLQFHWEATRKGAERFVEHCRNELVPAPYIQNPNQIVAGPFDIINRQMTTLLDAMEKI